MTRFTRRCGKLVAAVLAGGMVFAMPATSVAEPAAEPAAAPTVQADQTPVADSGVAFPAGTMTGCDDVRTWAKLAECAGNTTQDTVVTITASIVADKNATVNVTKTIGLTTTLDGSTPVLTSADGDTTGQLFDVKSGGKLIVGASANDKFTYGGTEDKTATRRFARVEANGTMQFSGGAFRYLTVNDLPATVDGQSETAAVALNMGGTLLVQGGAFDHITTGSANATGVFSNNGGTVTINGGTFENNEGVRGSVLSDMNVTGANSSTVTINGGTFESNHTSYAGGVAYLNNTGKTDGKYEGVYKVNGGTFQSNTSNTQGGVIHSGGSLTVTNGTFTGNVAKGNGGGALSNSDAGSLMVTGGLFTGNSQDPDPGQSCGLETNNGPCWRGTAGGGAIYSTGTTSSLTIQGGVIFKGNYAKARNFGSGGGAIWAQGKLWIRNSADAKATKPVFEGNWASISQPTAPAANKDIPTMLTGPATQVTAGGAGGAVFLMNNSTAFITGGEYKNNASGYLGGAIYTEESTTTYVGRAVAWSNTAGHFGGGLWFCPSGNSAASKGGNIALFDNKVNDQLDANTDNRSTASTQNKTAGSDLAIMNPYHKSRYRIRSNTFQLMDTWFTSRDSSTVDWYWDGVPALEASGYQDKWLGGDADQSVSTYNGVGDHANRYDENSTNNVKIGITTANNHSVTTCLYYTHGRDKGNDGQIDATNINTQADCTGKGYYQDGFGNQGLALKAVVPNTAEKDNAQSTGQILISGNGARLSGGGFGSNGVVVFDSPYSMSWNKADANTKDPVTSSSTWKITTTDAQLEDRDDGEEKSPYMAPSMRPAQCQAGGTLPKTCWQKDEDDKTWSVTVTDNDSTRDNDNTIGSISIDNLAPGTYTLKETIPPVGYELNTTEYTFTITAAGTDNKVPEQPTLTVPIGGNALVGSDGRTIGDTPVTGVLSWRKTDGTSPIPGSEWKITDSRGTTITGYEQIKDNTGESYDGKDLNATAGEFQIGLDMTGKNGLTAGQYTLVETKAPDGYWMPKGDAAKHDFTVTVSDDNKTITASWGDNSNGVIVNTVRSVSWTKTDADTGQAIGGAEWKLVRTKTVDGTAIGSDEQPAWTVLDCGSNADGCSTVNGRWADADTDPGKFTLEKLEPGTYELTETKAPAGYVMRKATYTFTITKDQPEQSVTLQSNGTDVPDNKVGNSRAISFLPSTGGPTPRGWLTIGMTLLAGSLAVTWWARRREAR